MMMRKKVFSLGQTAIYLHMGTVLFALYMVFGGHGLTLAVSLGSILLHEGAHAAVASFLGLPPQEIEITPLGALMRLEDEARFSSGKRIAILSAGPLSSLMLCWCAILMTRWGWLSIGMGRSLFCCNLLLALGNLLPVLPLDGGRMLALLLSLRMRGETLRQILRVSGTIVGLGCIGLNLVLSLRYGGWNFSCAMAGCFFMYSAAVETTSFAMAELRQFMDKKSRLEAHGMAPCRYVAATPQTPLRKALCSMPPAYYGMLCLFDPVDMQLLVQVCEGDLLAAYLNTPGERCQVLLASDSSQKSMRN